MLKMLDDVENLKRLLGGCRFACRGLSLNNFLIVLSSFRYWKSLAEVWES